MPELPKGASPVLPQPNAKESFMLKLRHVSKQYKTGELVQRALDDISLTLRDNEFVAVLGPSGSGKTTLLNVIGGLDRYDSGELIIDDISTKQYKDREWDAYRNHRIGFVFQSYNLIPHQTILSNVELALTISGIERKERRRRAAEALAEVGLGEQLHKRPNQLSGGQMQRVAIARALVNDPAILLADEPTGALDSETGLQVVELLKEVAEDRLVVMVTHNAELAERYATRIVELKDGKVISDSNPPEEEQDGKQEAEEKKRARLSRRSPGKASMSFGTALSLSFNNLRTKKGRTFLTAFAGSIGIIGIALILALSSGVNKYITDTQKETMRSYPIMIEAQSFDLNKIMKAGESHGKKEPEHALDAVYTDSRELEMSSLMNASVKKNNLTEFKHYLDDPKSEIHEVIGENGVVYSYNPKFHVYTKEPGGKLIKTDGSAFQDKAMIQAGRAPGPEQAGMQNPLMFPQEDGSRNFGEIMPDAEGALISPILRDNYELVYGREPRAKEELLLILNKHNEVSSRALYETGLLPAEDYEKILADIAEGKEIDPPETKLNYEDIIGKSYRLFAASDFFKENEAGVFVPEGTTSEAVEERLDEGLELKIVGIIRPREEAEYSPLREAIGYTRALTEYLMTHTAESPVVEAQEKDEAKNVLTGLAFAEEEGSSYEDNLKAFGLTDEDAPSKISLYADSFEDKDLITGCIDDYNDEAAEEDKIVYTDYVGLLMSSVTSMINVISYVLIAFVGVSLVVSSIMIGIITYISVLERTKEIGILRAIGASKRNIAQVFNAETFIIGLFSGALGIGISLLLMIPGNELIHRLTDSPEVNAYLPPMAAAVLILLSVLLTLLGGLIPSKIAAKKDPVAALRTD